MTKIDELKIQRFDAGDRFVVEATITDDYTELYLMNLEYGIKELMFGVITNVDTAIALAEQDIAFYKDNYKDKYMDKE